MLAKLFTPEEAALASALLPDDRDNLQLDDHVLLVVEDDDTACQIKTDSARVAKLFQQIQSTYGTFTAGKDTTLLSTRTWTKASSLLALFKTIWSVITTQDDIVGNAIEDAVAGQTWPGANWIVKGENTITTGGFHLEMR